MGTLHQFWRQRSSRLLLLPFCSFSTQKLQMLFLLSFLLFPSLVSNCCVITQVRRRDKNRIKKEDMMFCTRHRWRLYAKRKKFQVTDPTWSPLCFPPQFYLPAVKFQINMLERNDEKDTRVLCVRQKMLWSQINSPEFKFSSDSYKPFELSDLFCALNNIQAKRVCCYTGTHT